MSDQKTTTIPVILPLALPEPFTYWLPDALQGNTRPGMRVVVPVGKSKTYTGIIAGHETEIREDTNRLKEVLHLVDEEPLLDEKLLSLWRWISDYYFCTPGEVMKAALPAGMQAGELTGDKAKGYRPKTVNDIRLSPSCRLEALMEYMEKVVNRAPKQAALIKAYLQDCDPVKDFQMPCIPQAELLQRAGATLATLKTLIEKGYFELQTREISRFAPEENTALPPRKLSDHQENGLREIRQAFSGKKVVLLKGITSSGKTELYIHLIAEEIRRGRQVLYLLPEIALTGQIIRRLTRHFPGITGVYHSRLNTGERSEVFLRTGKKEDGFKLILGVRSSVFLPFHNLGLVIVDEEHDSSYKQYDPAPRYHARDTAIMLSALHRANILLGSATPSLESYANARSGKYTLVPLNERYGKIQLPEFILADTRRAYKRKQMVSHFAPELVYTMEEALKNQEQVVLFQNRRGFSPYLECPACGWIPGCPHCDVSLTYHKKDNKLVCHYCGYHSPIPRKCPSCSNPAILTRGFGTEKIEDEIALLFPDARISRLDLDTTRKKNAFDQIIQDFEKGQTDILIGTQMISKGLDFENLTVVGILSADHLLHFPDFRAHERSFQMMEQVAGRAGRKKKRGKVVIQTADPKHEVIQYVLRHDYEGMMQSLLRDRADFHYPPYTRLMGVHLKHKDLRKLNTAAERYNQLLRQAFGKRVLGPEFPLVSRVQSWYQKSFLLKIEKGHSPQRVRELLSDSRERFFKEVLSQGIRLHVDVDPY